MFLFQTTSAAAADDDDDDDDGDDVKKLYVSETMILCRHMTLMVTTNWYVPSLLVFISHQVWCYWYLLPATLSSVLCSNRIYRVYQKTRQLIFVLCLSNMNRFQWKNGKHVLEVTLNKTVHYVPTYLKYVQALPWEI